MHKAKQTKPRAGMNPSALVLVRLLCHSLLWVNVFCILPKFVTLIGLIKHKLACSWSKSIGGEIRLGEFSEEAGQSQESPASHRESKMRMLH